MPIAKIKGHKNERFRCENTEEIKVIDKVQDEYCKTHDNYEFVKEFFNRCSSFPGQYVRNVKKGNITVSPESWIKLTNYYQHCNP